MINIKELPTQALLNELGARYSDANPKKMEVLVKFIHLANELERVMETHFGRFGLSRGRFLILLLLGHCQKRSMSPSELAEKLDVTRGNMTGLIDGLEASGYIRRVSSPEDRRSCSVEITDEGQKKMAEILPVHYSRIARAMGAITLAECAQTVAIFDKLYLGLEEIRNPKE